MVTRIQPAVSDPEAARSIVGLLSQLPDSEPVAPAADSTQLLDSLKRQAEGALSDLPEVVLVHELIRPLPALELIREVALRFPSVGVVLITRDTSQPLYSAAMDAGARGVLGLPLSYDDLAARVGAASSWAVGVRKHLGTVPEEPAAGLGGTVVSVTGAKGGVGTTLAACQLALAAQASGRGTALVDLDLQSGDVASYLDVQFRRSAADLAGISDISARVLQDAVYAHESGLGLLLAPGEGERGEEVDDRAARQIIAALRARYDIVVIDCGTQLNAANAAAIETSDSAVLLTTPDVVSVRAAKRMVRMWDRLQIRKAEDTLTLVNRRSRNSEIQPPLIARITGTPVAGTTIPANYKDLQSAVDAGRIQDLDPKSSVRQALWAFAGELGIVTASEASGVLGKVGRGGVLGARAVKAAKGGGASGGGQDEGDEISQQALPSVSSGSGSGSGSGAVSPSGSINSGPAGGSSSVAGSVASTVSAFDSAFDSASGSGSGSSAASGAGPWPPSAGRTLPSAAGGQPSPGVAPGVAPGAPWGPPGQPTPGTGQSGAGQAGQAGPSGNGQSGHGHFGQQGQHGQQALPPASGRTLGAHEPIPPAPGQTQPGQREYRDYRGPREANSAAPFHTRTRVGPKGPDIGQQGQAQTGYAGQPGHPNPPGYGTPSGYSPQSGQQVRPGPPGSHSPLVQPPRPPRPPVPEDIDDDEGETSVWGERGAVSLEFAGMAPIVLVVLAVLWQCVLVGYTFSLAGNAADEAARAATASALDGDSEGACEDAAEENLPAEWRDDSTVDCRLDGHLWKADVGLSAPVLIPGAGKLPFSISGSAGAAEEASER